MVVGAIVNGECYAKGACMLDWNLKGDEGIGHMVIMRTCYLGKGKNKHKVPAKEATLGISYSRDSSDVSIAGGSEQGQVVKFQVRKVILGTSGLICPKQVEWGSCH